MKIIIQDLTNENLEETLIMQKELGKLMDKYIPKIFPPSDSNTDEDMNY